MRRPRSVAAVAACTTLVLGSPVAAQPVPPATDRPAAASARSVGATVTLITGDRVRLRTIAGGPQETVVVPARRPNGLVPQFRITVQGADTHVVPSDVAPLIPRVLDPALFNVTQLVKQRLDDANSPTLPLIATRRTAAARRTTNLPAGNAPTELASVNAVATEVTKQQIRELADALPALNPRGRSTGPLAGVQKIWLDRGVRVQLDRSTRQISAQAAWDAGFDGSGVTVAVLDTGVDDTHADLSGQVTAKRDFTDDQSPIDRHGHGTHVASTVAGTGAASGGKYRGVAPGANLINGKVLDNQGNGRISWVIEGMEWAAAQAKVVNMSLGMVPGNEDATLVREALEHLSTEHGTLFVVAAGNEGCDRCILSPGDAASALTVGAIDREDQLAPFSSRGPVHESHLLKPDVTAPGVGIVAARAKDAALGGEGDYLGLSGTSMATPHVAGAVALILQARPSLTPHDIKGALMSTAVPNDHLTPYEQGAGRIDVRRVLDADVLAASGPVDYGYFPFPQDGLDPVRKTVTYRNVSGQPVTLRLRTDIQDAMRVEPAQVLVQPGASATVDVVLDIANSAAGTFLGTLTAEGSNGQSLATPISYVADEEYFELKVSGLARDGRRVAPIVSSIVDVDDGSRYQLGECEDTPDPLVACARVPAGKYAVLGTIQTWPAWSDPVFGTPLHTALVGNPELTVTEDTEAVLDARKAVEVEVRTPDHDATTNPGGAVQIAWTRTPAHGQAVSDMVLNHPGAQLEERFFVQPMAAVRTGMFAMTTRWRLEEPDITMTTRSRPGRTELAPRYYQMGWFSDTSSEYPQFDGRTELAVVDAGEGRPDEINRASLSGALALIRRTDELPVAEQSNRAASAGARMVAIYNDRPGVNPSPGSIGTRLQVPTVHLSQSDGHALLAAIRDHQPTVSVRGTIASRYLYDLVYAERGRIPPTLRYTARTRDLVTVEHAFHSQESTSQTYSTETYVRFPWEQTVAGFSYSLRGAPRSRTDYQVWHPDSMTRHGVTTPELPYGAAPFPEPAYLAFGGPWTRPDRGTRSYLSWVDQPLRPGLNPRYPAVRSGDRVVLSPGFGSPDDQRAVGMLDGSDHFAPVFSSPAGEVSTRFRVWHGDALLTDTPHNPGAEENGFVTLPTEERATYRMRFELANTAGWSRLSTRSSTEWKFTSARPDSTQPLPLLTVSYGLDVDLRNRLERRGHPRVDVTIGHQPGSPAHRISGFAFATSYDDGRTWRPARTAKLCDGRYRVELGAPHGRHVSFKLYAVDAAGNTVGQEVIRAAALPN